ncbi:MAG: hypothetical protein ACUVX8_07680 [Candidatus Zipacnadales bacterium]
MLYLGFTSFAALHAQFTGGHLDEVLANRLGPGLAAYRAWDATTAGGLGHSNATTSGGLAWGESTFLRNYILCYQVTGDTYWLDKVIDHFDRMVENLADPDGDGYLAWSDVDYSVGLVEVSPQGEIGDLIIEPRSQRPYVKRGGEFVTGHEYRIEFIAADVLRVVDITVAEELATLPYADPTTIEAIPGAKLTIKGPGKLGAAFRVTTRAPEPCEYQVHDGMVTYPIAQFIEVAYTEASLPPKYHAKAQQYAALIDKHFFEKWERTWVDLPNGAGVYKFSSNPTQRFPSTSLPHNQYLALARTWLVLQAIPALQHRDQYRKRATEMALYFKQNLREQNGAYVWNYWDPLPHEEGIIPYVEDASHATIDISFVIEAAARGIVFTSQDIQRFAATYSELMWNGSLENPRFGPRVNTNNGDARPWWEWIQLGRASEKVCDIAAAIYAAEGYPSSMVPQLAALYDTVVGVSESQVAAYHTACRMMESPGLINSGFEVAGSGDAPLGWILTTWTPDEGGSATWVDQAHSGEKSIALTGAGERVNVVALPFRNLPAQGGQTVTVRVFYRAADTAQPAFSVVGYDAAGHRVQYSNSPTLKPTAEWTPATWSVALAKEVVEFNVILRNYGRGTVYYDDLELSIDQRFR